MEQKQKPVRSTSFNLDSDLSTKVFQRIMVRFKVHKVIKHWKKLSKNSFNRYKRIQQWVNTQKTYIDDMNLIINQIQKPLNEKNLITEEQDKILFPNLGGIIMLSEQMHQTMKGFLQTWHPVKTQIAQAVIRLSNFFKIYIEYFNNYERGKQILANIQQEKDFKSIEKSLKMDIASYLIKPVQRPLKYKLLLTDYQKKLRIDHPDYHALTKAIDIYHQVVEKTNQAMENQKHMKRMVQMEAKFKNILESSRQWKFEFEAWFEEEPEICKVYVFTDLLLVISPKFAKRQQLLCKMFLDGSSFVEACEQVFQAKKQILFIAGRQHVGHFAFQTLQERNRIFQKLSKLLNSIHVNQWKRRQQISRVQSRRFSSTRFSKPYFIQDYYEMFDNFNILKKKFRVTVCGVQRRTINKCFNSYFAIKLQLPFPQVINQKAFVKLQDLVDLERILQAAMNKWALVKAQQPQKIKWRTIQQLPKQLSKANDFQTDSICIQYRARLIESFLNFILRNKQTIKTSNLIFHKLKMFQSLFQKIKDQKNECQACQICQNGNIISSYESYKQQLQKRIEQKSFRKDQNMCTQRSFHCQNRLASLTKQKPRCTVQQIMLYINSKSGSINQALTNRIIQGQPIKINIYRPHWRDIIGQVQDRREKWFELDIYRRDTIGNVLQVIRKSLGLNGVKDYGLAIVSAGSAVVRLLHEDEYVVEVIKENGLSIWAKQKELGTETKSGIKGFFSKIKQKIDAKQQPKMKLPQHRIQFRKIYCFPQDIQTFTCLTDTSRYQLLTDQIFYQFKSKSLNLHHTGIVKLCALFICIQWNSRFPYMKKEDISKPLLSQIIPQSRMHLMNDNFVKQVHSILTIYKQKNIRERTTFMSQVIQIVKDNPGWNMQFFLVYNLRPTLPLPDQYLKLGINYQQLYIIREHNYLTPVAKIKLDKLNIKFSGYLIVITEQQREFRLMCDDVFMFRLVLEKYYMYNRYFLGKDRLVGRPLMEETI